MCLLCDRMFISNVDCWVLLNAAFHRIHTGVMVFPINILSRSDRILLQLVKNRYLVVCRHGWNYTCRSLSYKTLLYAIALRCDVWICVVSIVRTVPHLWFVISIWIGDSHCWSPRRNWKWKLDGQCDRNWKSVVFWYWWCSMWSRMGIISEVWVLWKCIERRQ